MSLMVQPTGCRVFNGPAGSCVFNGQKDHTEHMIEQFLALFKDAYGSGHGTAAVLLPGFAINW